MWAEGFWSEGFWAEGFWSGFGNPKKKGKRAKRRVSVKGPEFQIRRPEVPPIEIPRERFVLELPDPPPPLAELSPLPRQNFDFNVNQNINRTITERQLRKRSDDDAILALLL